MLGASTLLFLLANPSSPGELGPVPAGTIRVFLVRHGQALSNLDPAPDLPPEKLDHLTPLGITQARNAAHALSTARIVAILSSPARRARETAEILKAAIAPVEVHVERRLRPLDLGRREDGRPFDWDERIAEWKAGRDPAPEGGESLEAVGRRVLDLVRSLVPEPVPDHGGRSVLLVAHSEVITAFTAVIEGAAPAKRWPPKVPNGSVTVVETRGSALPALVLSGWIPPSAASPEPSEGARVDANGATVRAVR